MTQNAIVSQIESARMSIARNAIASPYLHREYHAWTSAKSELLRAQETLKVAEARWIKTIEPAITKDKLLRQLAERDNLIPESYQPPSKGKR